MMTGKQHYHQMYYNQVCPVRSTDSSVFMCVDRVSTRFFFYGNPSRRVRQVVLVHLAPNTAACQGHPGICGTLVIHKRDLRSGNTFLPRDGAAMMSSFGSGATPTLAVLSMVDSFLANHIPCAVSVSRRMRCFRRHIVSMGAGHEDS